MAALSGPPLVTGGTGFAGSHLIEHLLTRHPHVAAWGHAGGRVIERHDARVEWDDVDLLDAPGVTRSLARLKPSAIYHCAGMAHVVESSSDPARALSVNVLGTHHVLDGLVRAGLTCPVLVTGSAMVYRTSASALREEDLIQPSTLYGLTKLAQEMLAARAAAARVFVVRPFNHAGPRQSTTFVTSSFARQIADIEAGRADPVLRVGNLDARRDITDVRDTVRAYALVVEHGQPRTPYNVCSGRAYRVGDLLDALLARSTRAISVTQDVSRLRPSDNPLIVGDASRLTAATGWTPEIPIERTLTDLLDYWRAETARAAPPPA